MREEERSTGGGGAGTIWSPELLRRPWPAAAEGGARRGRRPEGRGRGKRVRGGSPAHQELDGVVGEGRGGLTATETSSIQRRKADVRGAILPIGSVPASASGGGERLARGGPGGGLRFVGDSRKRRRVVATVELGFGRGRVPEREEEREGRVQGEMKSREQGQSSGHSYPRRGQAGRQGGGGMASAAASFWPEEEEKKQ